ncbi:hypothetical protein [Catenulispora sp. GAS73]|uniref:hypothetical protein n=1 Tax=Catenulispora sp. GAS73 TaxID=3156269 RepID=UPI0035135A3A
MATAPQVSTLPNGDRVLIFGSGPAADIAVLAPDGSTVRAVRYAPNPQHAYVIPESVMATPDQFVASQYQVPGLSVAGPPATPEHFPLHILQINAVGLDGAAADCFTLLTNVDDINRWSTPIVVANGVARVAVPAGHYSATTIFSSYDSMANQTIHVVTQPDITVTDTGVTTVSADERTASARVRATTPKPAVNASEYLLFDSTDINGLTSDFQLSSNGGPIYVSPTAAPRVGRFKYQVFDWSASSPAGTVDPYHYDMMFPPTDRIDTNQDYRIDASKLETIHNTFDTDPTNPSRQGEFLSGAKTAEIGAVLTGDLVATPGALTTYYGAPIGDGNYEHIVLPELPSLNRGPNGVIFLQADDPAYTRAGEMRLTWGHGPLAPQVGQFAGGTWCRACVDGGSVVLAVNEVQDSSQDTEGQLYGPIAGLLTIYRDGNQVFSQEGFYGADLTNQAQKPGTYRFVYDQDLSAFGFTQSTATLTDVTVPYTPTPDPKWTLPAGNTCEVQAGSTTPCSILPMLNLNYHLATNDTNTSHGRLQILDLRVDHQSYGGAGSHAPVTSATVSVSFNKGASWTAAAMVQAGQNHFVAWWKNTGAKGSTPWLKVTATDALGGSIAQTVDNAYTIG